MSKFVYYTVSYDGELDDFYAIVDWFGQNGLEDLYCIGSTKEVCELIKTGTMKHIDDVDGLKEFLIGQEILAKEDRLFMVTKTMW